MADREIYVRMLAAAFIRAVFPDRAQCVCTLMENTVEMGVIVPPLIGEINERYKRQDRGKWRGYEEFLKFCALDLVLVSRGSCKSYTAG